MKSNQNLRVFWKLVIYKTAYGRIFTKSSCGLDRRKKRQFTTALQFGSQIYSYASSCENSRSKDSSGQGMGKIGKILAWNLTKFRSKKEVIDEARTKGEKVHFASLMDICHLKNAELEAKHPK